MSKDQRCEEIELKFRASRNVLDRIFAHGAFVGELRLSQLRTVYFDTHRRELRKNGFGPRVRHTGDGHVQTLKHSRGPGGISRGEWETQVNGPVVDENALANTPAGRVIKGDCRNLAPLFETIIERRSGLIHADGATIEAAFDVGEIRSGDRREDVCELELELKEGRSAALFALGRRFVDDHGLILSFESKSQRGYELTDNKRLDASHAELPRLEASLPTAEAFRLIAFSCLAQVSANAGAVLIRPPVS